MVLNLEELNVTWFQSINASAHAPEWVVGIATFFAEYALYVLPLFLLFLWFLGTQTQKEIVLKSVMIACLSLCIGQLIGTFFPHPRPFMMKVGRTLLDHAANASFPSHHMIFFSAVCISHFLAKAYKLSIIFLMLALLVAWSRIYLGVHFPFDMIGAFLIVLCVALVCEPLWKHMKNIIRKV